MASLCPFEVKEAADGDAVLPGRVLIAPGGKQMSLKGRDPYHVAVTDDPPVNRHKPSVDVLFNSAVKVYKGKMMGVILTGMGADGAKGLLNMKNAGAYTIAQSERTCVVFGMPREAIELNAHSEIADLERVPEAMIRRLTGKKAA
jgi:two-component system chemotaxis response regulator CheB